MPALCNPPSGDRIDREQEEFPARPAPHAAVEPISEFFVSTATAGQYLAAGWVLRIRFSIQVETAGTSVENAAGAAPESRGVDDLSFENESDRRRKSEPALPADSEDMPVKSRKRRGSNSEIGQALRQAYSDAVDETVPPEFLDLLGRLG
ncbi:MAG: NepR family anti-sigma factor [Allosphingosinicella sp.]